MPYCNGLAHCQLSVYNAGRHGQKTVFAQASLPLTLLQAVWLTSC